MPSSCALLGGFAIGVQCVAYEFRCYDNIHVCKLIALFTGNAYSAERKMSASDCSLSVAGF